jgi:UDP-N-acetyl-D-galactosamine dehydrogenase
MAFSKHFQTSAFDISKRRIDELKQGFDRTGEFAAEALKQSTLQLSAEIGDLPKSTFYVITVPTPIDAQNRPNFAPLISASKIVGAQLCKGDMVVYESTVYPGATQEVCVPILEENSGLQAQVDFDVGYSPERINPGDREHSLTRIPKVVSALGAAALDRVARVYGKIITAGIHRASSIAVAEAAKVIENTQRDLNIALMNEFALICDRLGIRTTEVLEAASTKWNFLPFRPGLVGGHCIGVDPYYLTTKAEELGYYPQVVLAGRRINNSMGHFLGQKVVKELVRLGIACQEARVGILGLTFKEDVPDLRNTRVIDILTELAQYRIHPTVHCAMGDPEEALALYGVTLQPWHALRDLDALVLAVPHKAYRDMPRTELLSALRPRATLIDIKSALDPTGLPEGISYWSL